MRAFVAVFTIRAMGAWPSPTSPAESPSIGMQSTRDPRGQTSLEGPATGGLLAVSPFLTTPAEAFGKPVCRLGLASHGRTSTTPGDVLHAPERGVNFLLWAMSPAAPLNPRSVGQRQATTRACVWWIVR